MIWDLPSLRLQNNSDTEVHGSIFNIYRRMDKVYKAGCVCGSPRLWKDSCDCTWPETASLYCSLGSGAAPLWLEALFQLPLRKLGHVVRCGPTSLSRLPASRRTTHLHAAEEGRARLVCRESLQSLRDQSDATMLQVKRCPPLVVTTLALQPELSVHILDKCLVRRDVPAYSSARNVGPIFSMKSLPMV